MVKRSGIKKGKNTWRYVVIQYSIEASVYFKFEVFSHIFSKKSKIGLFIRIFALYSHTIQLYDVNRIHSRQFSVLQR